MASSGAQAAQLLARLATPHPAVQHAAVAALLADAGKQGGQRDTALLAQALASDQPVRCC